MYTVTLPNEEELYSYLKEIYIQGVTVNKTRSEFHHFLQNSIADLASKFDLTPVKEYVITNFRANRNGKIDVIWKAGSIPVVAFEIDPCRSVRSLQKLLSLDTNLKFWIYCGISPIKSFITSNDPDGRIKIIQFPTVFTKFGIKPRTISKASNDNKMLVEKSYSFIEVRKSLPNAYEKWTDEQDDYLRASLKIGLPKEVIAQNLSRTEGAIRSRIKKLSEN